MRTYLFFSNVIRYLAIGLTVGAIAAAVWIYVPDRYDPATSRFYDGLGRELYAGALIPFGERGPGLLWEVVDLVVAVMTLGGISQMLRFSTSLRKRAVQRDTRLENALPGK